MAKVENLNKKKGFKDQYESDSGKDLGERINM